MDAYFNRGIAKRAKGDLDGALKDYDLALAIDPNYAFGYNLRSSARRAKDDLDGALADYNRAIELDPQYVEAFAGRGLTRFARGEFAQAAPDLARAQELKPDPLIPLWLHLARSRSGGDGRRDLLAYAAKADMGKWPAPLIELYVGKGSVAAALEMADSADARIKRERTCQAHFFSGQWQMLARDWVRATASLRLAREQCPRNFVEYSSAEHELRRLAAQPPARP